MITKDIDYTGCHPVIAEFFENNPGRSVKCEVDYDRDIIETDYIINYCYNWQEKVGWYFGENDTWSNARPFKKKIVKSFKEIMKIFIEEGWVPTLSGYIKNDGESIFDHQQFDYCGESPNEYFQWPKNFLKDGK